MEKIFTNAVKKQLKQRIKGEIYAHVVDGVLVIDIYSRGCIVWHYAINKLAVQLSAGLSSKIVADVIVKEYRRYVLDTYFIK